MKIELDRAARTLEPIVAGGLILSGVILLGLARFFPFSSLPPLCTFKGLTGLPCLTCGMTRSWVALLHGDLPQAFVWNPIGATLCLVTVLGTLYLIGRTFGAPALRLASSPGERRALRVGLVLGVAVNWLFVFGQGQV